MTTQNQLDTTYSTLIDAAQQLINGITDPVLPDGSRLETLDQEVDIDSYEVIYTAGELTTIYVAFDADSYEGTLIAEHGDEHLEKDFDSDTAAVLFNYYFN